jgi:hypothetical protein
MAKQVKCNSNCCGGGYFKGVRPYYFLFSSRLPRSPNIKLLFHVHFLLEILTLSIMSLFSSAVLVLAVAVSSAVGFTPFGQTFQVEVGANGNLTFNPETITANVGDTVIYNFHPKVSLSFPKVFGETTIDFNRTILLHSQASGIHVILLPADSSLDLYPQTISQLHLLQLLQSQLKTPNRYGFTVLRLKAIIARRAWFTRSMRQWGPIYYLNDAD